MSIDMTLPTDLCLDSPLWQFAGSFWSREGAQHTALTLQEQGWSVTDLLCGLWLASRYRSFPGFRDDPDRQDSFQKKVNQVLVWRAHVTQTLRQVRKTIKKGNPSTEGARTRVAQSELKAERVELALAYRAIAEDPQASSAAQQSPVADLALKNLLAASPEKANAMDTETERLLTSLVNELGCFIEEARQAC